MLSTQAIGALSPAPALGSVAPAKPISQAPPSGEASFGSIFASLTSNTVSALQAGEAAALSGIQGKAAIQDVVHSVMNAEQTLQAAIAIRDKVVSAYLEISRMQI